MRGDALLGDAVHFLGTDLDFKRLARVDDGGVERLIEVGTRHGDVVFEAARDRGPNLMHNAESGVTVLDRIGDDADGHQIVDLIESALLALHFLVQRVEAFGAAFDFGGEAVFDHFFANGVLNFVEKLFLNFGFGGDFFL